MHHLNEIATSDYFELTFGSRQVGFIGETVFLERMSLLSAIGFPKYPVTEHAEIIARRAEWLIQDHEWTSRSSTGEATDSLSSSGESGVQIDDDGYLYFKTNAGGLKDWYFRPGDADFFPSIPHGHWQNLGQPKLDAYLGWTYVGSKQTGRISRDAIVALWNDETFRKIALQAIDFYCDFAPRYKWRVPNPRALPRRRKS